MRKSSCLFVVFFYIKGKIVAAHSMIVHSIAVDNTVKNTALTHNVEYDDYSIAFISPLN